MKMWTCTPPRWQGGRRRASGVGNSLLFLVFFYIWTLFWYPFCEFSVPRGTSPRTTCLFPPCLPGSDLGFRVYGCRIFSVR